MKMIFGLPSTGKTTYLTKIALDALKKGEYEGLEIDRVYTNWAINHPDIYQLEWDKLGYEQYEKALILIDEISSYADNRNWKENLEHQKLMFFKLYRHYRLQIIYCSQSWDDCDKKIRNLTDQFYMIESLPFGFSKITQISMFQNIDGKINTGYEKKGMPKIFYRGKYYKYFDSYEAPQLKPNTAKTWIPSNSLQNALECPSNSTNIITLPTSLEREKTLIDTYKSNKNIKIYKK